MEDAAQLDRLGAEGRFVSAAIKGRCPGILRPMRSGDGLLVRIRPHGGRLDAAQAGGVAELAGRYGNGLIDLTSRANLQVRGVGEDGHRPLVEALARLGLADPDPATEARRNNMVTPFWRADDDTPKLAAELEQALAESSLDLPAKFGFAVDGGPERALAGDGADIRIERGAAGGLILRANGAPAGRFVTRQEAVPAALALAAWFIESGGMRGGRGRMAAHLRAGASLPDRLRGEAMPAPMVAAPRPGLRPEGAMVGIAFGQLTHASLGLLAARARGLRLTPWRMILAEGLSDMPEAAGLVIRPDDPLLHIAVCPGAPACREAHAETRPLAAALAPHLAAGARLHVSGCAKGCAQAGAASIALVATGEGFDVIREGTVRDAPVLRGLSGARLLADPSRLQGR